MTLVDAPFGACLPSVRDVDAPAVWDAFEFVFACGFAYEAAPCDEVFHGLRDQHL